MSFMHCGFLMRVDDAGCVSKYRLIKRLRLAPRRKRASAKWIDTTRTRGRENTPHTHTRERIEAARVCFFWISVYVHSSSRWLARTALITSSALARSHSSSAASVYLYINTHSAALGAGTHTNTHVTTHEIAKYNHVPAPAVAQGHHQCGHLYMEDPSCLLMCPAVCFGYLARLLLWL